MDINPLSEDCQELRNRIEAMILKHYKALSHGNMNEMAKDAATTWWIRGQVKGLETIKELIKE